MPEGIFGSLFLGVIPFYNFMTLKKLDTLNFVVQLDIPPGGREAFLVSRDRRANHGTLAYNIGSYDLRLLIMWTSGMNFDHFANILAAGITPALNTDKFRQVHNL